MFGDLTVENKLQRQTEDFSNIIISTKYQYSSEVGQEGGVWSMTMLEGPDGVRESQ